MNGKLIRCYNNASFIFAGNNVDLNVRQRLAKIRRNFLTLGWASAPEQEAPHDDQKSGISPEAQEPARDLILEDTLTGYETISAANGITWHSVNPGLFDDDGGWTPSPRTRAAVFGLADKIRTEGEALVDLSARTRREVEQLLREHSAAMNRIQAEASPDFSGWELHTASANELIRRIGATALSAALSGVRAGASARGFGQVARGVDELERVLRSGWTEIEALICDLEDLAAKTAAASANLRGTGKAFAESAAALLRNARPHPAAAARLAELRRLTDEAAQTGGDVAATCDEMAHLVHTLAEQLVIVVRETPIGNRRNATRIAFEASCIIATSERSYAGKSLDLSATGALIRVRPETNLQRGRPITLHFQDMAPIIGTVAEVSLQGVHVSFDLGHGANAAAKPALLAMLDALLDRSRDLIERSTRLAREIREAMEQALAQDLISPDELLSSEDEPVMGASPQQFRHPATPFYEETLTPILDAFARNSPNALRAVAMDRSGCVAAHSSVQADDRANGPVRSPKRKTYADGLNQRAARNLRPFLIQIAPLKLAQTDAAGAGSGETIRSVSVPIFVGGRHWGCAEIGYRLEDDDGAFSTTGT